MVTAVLLWYLEDKFWNLLLKIPKSNSLQLHIMSYILLYLLATLKPGIGWCSVPAWFIEIAIKNLILEFAIKSKSNSLQLQIITSNILLYLLATLKPGTGWHTCA